MSDVFSLDGRVAVVTGGTGAIGSALARGPRPRRRAGRRARARRVDRVAHTRPACATAGHEALGVSADVLDLASLEAARDAVLERFGAIDVLVNCAGGNVAAATVPEDISPFDVPLEAYATSSTSTSSARCFQSQVFGAAMPARAAARSSTSRRWRPAAP